MHMDMIDTWSRASRPYSKLARAVVLFAYQSWQAAGLSMLNVMHEPSTAYLFHMMWGCSMKELA